LHHPPKVSNRYIVSFTGDVLGYALFTPPALFTDFVIDKKIRPRRFALVYERLRCDPWRPWGWGETTRSQTVIDKKILWSFALVRL